MHEMLTSEGFEVSSVPNGRALLRQFPQVKPHVVVLDVQMPFLNGFEVCRRLKNDAETRLTPVVIMTALSATEDRVCGIEAGADDFLTKPVARIELVARLRSLVSLKTFTDELEHAETVLFSLARSIEAKDPYTRGHCERLSEYSSELARQLGLSNEQVTGLYRAGIVHDIGKVAIPDAILLKPARLSDSERAIMQEHAVIGERICSPLKSLREVLPIIRHHHEKRDGTGYPDGLKGNAIPFTARVLQIVDVFDALTTQRPYKPALSTAEALLMMQAEVDRGWWDPEIFRHFKGLRASDPIAHSAGLVSNRQAR
jgi:putative two-component system response regulator